MAPGSISAEGIGERFEGASLETIRYMGASGLGMTVVPCRAARCAAVPDRAEGEAAAHRLSAIA